MKINDLVPVTIAGQVVAQATVREMSEGTATLVVPATLVVMAVRTELAFETPAADTTGTETIITGVDRAGQSAEPVETTSAPVVDAAAVDGSVESVEPFADNIQPPSTDTVVPPVTTNGPVENNEVMDVGSAE